MERCRRIFVLALLSLALSGPLHADTRTENIDVIVALDRSLSMEFKIDAVKSYATDNLVDQVLIPGDFLVVVAFFGKAEVVVSQFVKTEADRAAVKAAINRLQGNGRFTDIGNALDALQEQAARYEGDGRRKYVLLITDGIQEAPPTSKYWSKDGSFNHALLANTKTIQQKGWKILILGIGGDTAARDLARALGGSYGELKGELSTAEIQSQTENFLGTIEVVPASARLSPVGGNLRSVLTLDLRSEGFSRPVRMMVSGVAASVGGAPGVEALTTSPLALEVAASGVTRVRIPLRLPAGLPAGTHPCELAFSFLAGESFIPATLTLPLTVRGWIGSNPLPAAGIGLGAAALLAVLVALILLLARGRPVRFAVLVDRKPLTPRPLALRRGGRLYLAEIGSVFSIAASRTGKAIAAFVVRGDRLAMEFLKPDRFPKVERPPTDARGSTLPVRASDGTRHELKVQQKERAH